MREGGQSQRTGAGARQEQSTSTRRISRREGDRAREPANRQGSPGATKQRPGLVKLSTVLRHLLTGTNQSRSVLPRLSAQPGSLSLQL